MIDYNLAVRDIAERLHLWQPADRRKVRAALQLHGTDAIWSLVHDSLLYEQADAGLRRRDVFFRLLAQLGKSHSGEVGT